MAHMTSDIWQHFTKSESGAKCRYCQQIVSYCKGSTSNLKRHIGRKHPTVPLYRSNPLSTTNSEIDSPLEGTSGQQNVCTTITNFFQPSKPMSSESKKKIDSLLLLMICKEYHPFSIVENEYFGDFVKALNPKYELPTRKSISNAALPALYNETLEVVKSKLLIASTVSLTADCWTSINNDNFCAVTAHFINNKYELCSYLLECSDFSITHTGKNIADWITTVTNTFEISDKLFTLVTDNATNMKSAATILNLSHLPCGAHTLNLVVQRGLQKIKSTIENVKSIVMHFKKSSKAAQKLAEMQTSLNHPLLKIKQDCPTRWNSTYEMLDRFKQNRIPLASCIATLKISCKLEEEDWLIIEQATKILKLFNTVTIEIMAEKTISISTMGFLTRSLLQKIIEKKEKEVLHHKVIDLVDDLILGLKTRFETTNNLEIVSYAILLDPRLKKDGFLGSDAQYQNVYTHMIEKMIPFQNRMDTQIKDNAEKDLDSDDDIWQPLKKVHQSEHTSSARILAALELDRYISEKKLQVKCDPFLWWKEREVIYPTLSYFAKQYLSIPASSVPCERIFSKAGNILTEKRNRLTSKKLKEIIFIKQNYHNL
ncbi:E3 SUMO-protein ligase ZBED1-like [Anopheles funestus]|uniref:E3 SUMO-protein ligase ZBED1-like n=1 Tax=Anopheles funestus TaxID=62324 RepID=UPI0020C68361|nr:E3 SUMO-protein ligase ZBED1-like [Anopheles funestus]